MFSPVTVINWFYLKKRWTELKKEEDSLKNRGRPGLKNYLNNLGGVGRILVIAFITYYLGFAGLCIFSEPRNGDTLLIFTPYLMGFN